ncbi:MAG: sigma-54-dependent Fis family transcriptional regulator [Acidobacteria bacterium]|nr:MAG: sigma-54-dependent Fis family transcriptional regulator [Acidobacteriota bacterium]
MSQDQQLKGRLLAQVRQLEDLLRGWTDRQHGEGLTGADCNRLQQVAGHLHRLAEAPAGGIEPPAASSPACMLIGEGPAMSRLRNLIGRIAPRDSNVLILGDSGTGKELVARAIHTSGPRRHGRFVAMDCGALSDTLLESELFGHRRGAFTGANTDRVGLLEEAHDGTLFLDELANASPAFQTRLLRVLQEGEIRRVGENRTRFVDLRVIAATSGDLPNLVREGRFRGDLYYRINVLALTLPPLCQRREDIPTLLSHFLAEMEARHALPPRRFSAAVLEILLRYRWPGNVRELRNVVERAALMSTAVEITPEDLPVELLDDLLRGDSEEGAPIVTKTGEQRMIEHALLEANGERTRAARIIGWPRSKLYRRLHSYAIPSGFGRKAQQP